MKIVEINSAAYDRFRNNPLENLVTHVWKDAILMLACGLEPKKLIDSLLQVLGSCSWGRGNPNIWREETVQRGWLAHAVPGSVRCKRILGKISLWRSSIAEAMINGLQMQG